MEKGLKNEKWTQITNISLENSDFPSGQDKTEAFVNLFAENSLSFDLSPSIITIRKQEEQKEEYQDAIPNQYKK